MNLKNIAQTAKLTAKIEFQDGIIVELQYTPRARLQQIARECTIHRWEKDKGERIPDLDGKKLAEKFAAEVVKGWEGLTLKKAANLVPLDLSGQDPAAEVSFDKENLAYLVTNSYDFDVFIQKTAMDLSAFNTDHVEEMGNSAASQTGS